MGSAVAWGARRGAKMPGPFRLEWFAPRRRKCLAPVSFDLLIDTPQIPRADVDRRQPRERKSMRNVTAALIASLGLVFAIGCVQSPTGPGLIYMNVKGPLGPAGGESAAKTGKSCARVVLALFAWGDASIESAKRNGGITEVTTIDHESFNLIGFGSFCTVVYGQ
jgi:hypothetical protein